MTAFCNSCGAALPSAARFCSVCGSVVAGVPPVAYQPGYPPPPFFEQRLRRPVFGRQFAGVCAAFAKTYGWEISLVRILMVVAGIFLFPIPEIVYLACWVGIPQEQLELPPPHPVPPHQV